MSCKDEATIWMSNSAMNMPTHMTTKGNSSATSRRTDAAVIAPISARERVSTLASSKGPAGTRRAASSSSSAMRTGTRWTILVKLPVAFSGGITLNIAPVAGRKAEDVAVEDMAGQGVGDDGRRLAGSHPLELVLLEIRIDPQTVRRNDGEKVGALGDIGADLGGAVADIAVDRRTDFRIAQIEAGGSRSAWACATSASAAAISVSSTASCCLAATSPACDD